MLETGLKGRKEMTVSAEDTAAVIGSGLVRVLATPRMIALMENTCSWSVQGELEDGQSTVGTRIDMSHVAATPVGMKAWCESELVEIDRRRLRFKVTAYDEAGVIGEGFHERFIINLDHFQAKADAKLQQD